MLAEGLFGLLSALRVVAASCSSLCDVLRHATGTTQRGWHNLLWRFRNSQQLHA